MSITTTLTRFTSITRIVLAVLAAAIAVTAISPAVSTAAQNNGGGPSSSDSELCNRLYDRLKRYNDMANDPSEPKNVREFYKGRAANTLDRARLAGCRWATMQAAKAETTPTTPADAVATRITSKRAKYDRLVTARRASTRSAKRRATAGGTQLSTSQSTVSAIKPTTTGNQQQDDYCAGVAKLVADAETQGNQALLNGDQASADAWYDLADEFVDRATQNGCRFVFGLVAQVKVDGVTSRR